MRTAVEETGLDRQAHSTLTLWICRGYSGEICRVDVNRADSVLESIPAIAERTGYTSPDWERIGLYNLTRDFEYEFDDRWQDTFTEEGDLVIMADGAACHK